MANRTGQGMSAPQLNRQVGTTGDIPRIQYSTTGASSTAMAAATYSIADVMARMSSRVEDRLDRLAADESRKEGVAAGLKTGVPVVADESTIRGRAFNQSARETTSMRFEIEGRQQLSDLEQKNMNSSGKFRAASDAYLKGVLPQLQTYDPELAARFEGDFKLRTTDATNRIIGRERAIARDQQLETALRLQEQANDEMAAQARELFSGNPQNASDTMLKMTSNAARIVDTANQVGPDGTPLFSARERIALERAAEENVAKQVSTAWLSQQDDLVGALDTWRKGNAEVKLVDENGKETTVKVREMLGERGYQIAQQGFYDNLRSELALQNQVDAAQDRAFKENSDAVYTDMMRISQQSAPPLPPGVQGPPQPVSLTVDMVEKARPQLEPDKYLQLRSIAIGGGATVSDGAEYSRLATADSSGQDIRPQLQAAYTGGRLTTSDYTTLYERNTSRMDRGIIQPVAQGRDFVGNSLGRLATELGLPQSMAIPQAEGEYAVRVDTFIQKNGRQPTTTEALDIGREVVRRYSVMDTSQTLSSLPTPLLMTPAQKFSDLKSADVETIVQKTRAQFLSKHGGDAKKMEADDIFLEEMSLLQQYYDLIKVRDGNAGQSRAAE